MSLIKRYVHAVGRRLPERSRRDIEKELESLIMDALDARALPGEPYAEDDVVAVLREFGPPHEVADRYAPAPQHLIGPRLFPLYRLILSIVVGAIFLALTIAMSIQILRSGSGDFNVGSHLAGLFGGILSGIMSAVGSVTIIFAILERVLSEAELKEADISFLGKEPWDPTKLPAVSALRDWGGVAKNAVSLAFTVLAMILLNLFSQKGGIYFSFDSVWQFVPVITPEALNMYVPMWNVVWVLTIVHYLILLVRREWRMGSRYLDISVALANVGVLLVMAAGVSIIDAQAMLPHVDQLAVEGLTMVANVINNGLRISFVIAAMVVIVETAAKTFKLHKSEQHPSDID